MSGCVTRLLFIAEIVLVLFLSSRITKMSVSTAALCFAGMSVYAVTAKRDLAGIGNYLIMGLWGLVIASVVNLFLKSGF